MIKFLEIVTPIMIMTLGYTSFFALFVFLMMLLLSYIKKSTKASYYFFYFAANKKKIIKWLNENGYSEKENK